MTDTTIGAQNSPFGWGIASHDGNRVADQNGGYACGPAQLGGDRPSAALVKGIGASSISRVMAPGT